jgi:hypothetical protein
MSPTVRINLPPIARGHLMAKEMFHLRSNSRAATVVGLLLSGQGLIAISFALNLGVQACRFEM